VGELRPVNVVRARYAERTIGYATKVVKPMIGGARKI